MKRLSKVQIAVLFAAPLLIGASLTEGAVMSPYTQLSLSGVGYDQQQTEYMMIGASASNFSMSPSNAMERNAATMDKLRRKLAQLRIDPKDIRTSNFQFTKARDPEDDSSSPRRGYAVNHQLAVVVRDPKRAGPVMDALVDVGADNLSVQNRHGYSSEVDPEALRRARGDAIKDARAKAADYAKSLDMRVRRIVEIRDGSGHVTDRPVAAARVAAMDVPTQIDAPAATVVASVNVVFELEK